MTDIQTLYSCFLSCACVTTDSRNCPTGSLFIALKGASFNGNAFAAKALEAGSRYAVIDEPAYLPAGDSRYLLVEDCLRALQQLANYHRRQLATPIIGITGTNGKTTTKELIAAVLKRQRRILYTEGNLNNAIGVPLTLLRLKPEHELAVVEMGASHPGDIKELVDIAEPDFGLITNVGKAHLQGFGSLEGVIRTKGELYDFLRTKGDATVFIDHDNPYLMDIAEGLNLVCYGREESAVCEGSGACKELAGRATNDEGEQLAICGRITGNSPFLSLCWREAGSAEEHPVQTQLIGEYNFCNALAAIAIGRHFGIEPQEIDAALTTYAPTNNRSQLMQTPRNTLIIDAYNANPTSMMAALSNFRNMQAAEKMLILGDMRELGAESAAEHQRIANYLQECGFKQVMLVGSEFAAARHPFPTYPDVEALKEVLLANPPQGQTILIKGSNGIHLNSVIDLL